MTPFSQWISQFCPQHHVTALPLRKSPTSVRPLNPAPDSRMILEVSAQLRCTAVLRQALLPAARRTMVQHQTHSFAANVTYSVQSRFYKPGISRRALLLPAHWSLNANRRVSPVERLWP